MKSSTPLPRVVAKQVRSTPRLINQAALNDIDVAERRFDEFVGRIKGGAAETAENVGVRLETADL